MPGGEPARMLRCVHVRILAIALLGVIVACGDATPDDAAAPAKNEAQAARAATEPTKEAKQKKPPRRERPLPNFAGQPPAGGKITSFHPVP